jgi:hypothetical protein
MSALTQLSHEEKVLLAGCMRAAIVADATFDEAEMGDLDKIRKELEFHDYEECLEEFESRNSEDEYLFTSAARIKSPAAQDLILRVVYDLSLQNGAQESPQRELFQKLNRLWERT